jgi:hypothetical protein
MKIMIVKNVMKIVRNVKEKEKKIVLEIWIKKFVKEKMGILDNIGMF